MAVKKSKADILKNAVNLLDDNQKAIGNKLLVRLEFMEKTLDGLQKDIDKNGAVVTSVNGNGFEVRNENPSQKSYIQMIGKYNAMIKSLTDLLPKETSSSDELMDFIKR